MFNLSSMFSGFGGKQNQNQNQNAPDLPRMRPQTPGTSTKHGKTSFHDTRDTDYRPSNTSLLNMSNPFEKITERGQKHLDLPDPQTENLLDRSVKITFPKNAEGGVISEATLREKVGRFGDLVNVGMKEKLAVALFATSTQALVFCVFHDNVLGNNYKVKYMGTKSMSDDELQEQLLQHQLQQQKPLTLSLSTPYSDPTHDDPETVFSPPSQLTFPASTPYAGSNSTDVLNKTRSGSETESDEGDPSKVRGTGRISPPFHIDTAVSMGESSSDSEGTYRRDLRSNPNKTNMSHLMRIDEDSYSSSKGNSSKGAGIGGAGSPSGVTSSKEWARSSSKKIDAPSPLYPPSTPRGLTDPVQTPRSPIAVQLQRAQEEVLTNEKKLDPSPRHSGDSWKSAKVSTQNVYSRHAEEMDRRERALSSGSERDDRQSLKQRETMKLESIDEVSLYSPVILTGEGIGRGGQIGAKEGQGAPPSQRPVSSPPAPPVLLSFDTQDSVGGPMSPLGMPPLGAGTSPFDPPSRPPFDPPHNPPHRPEEPLERSISSRLRIGEEVQVEVPSTASGRQSPMIVSVQKRPVKILTAEKNAIMNNESHNSFFANRSGEYDRFQPPTMEPLTFMERGRKSPGKGRREQEEGFYGFGSPCPQSYRSSSRSSSSNSNSPTNSVSPTSPHSPHSDRRDPQSRSPTVASEGRSIISKMSPSSKQSPNRRPHTSHGTSHGKREGTARLTDGYEREIFSLKKTIVLLESQAMVRQEELGDLSLELRRSEEQWAVTLSALTLRNIALEAENRVLKEGVQSFKMSEIIKDARISVLTGSLSGAREEVSRLQTEATQREMRGEQGTEQPSAEAVITVDTISGSAVNAAEDRQSSRRGSERGSVRGTEDSHEPLLVLGKPASPQSEEVQVIVIPSPPSSTPSPTDRIDKIDIPSVPPVRATAIAGSGYPSKASRSLLEDLVSTRKELNKYADMAYPPKSSSGRRYDSKYDDTALDPSPRYRDSEPSPRYSDSEPSPRYRDSGFSALHAIARGDFFDVKTTSPRGDRGDGRGERGERYHQDAYRTYPPAPPHETLPHKQPRGPPPQQFMSYYSHLLNPPPVTLPTPPSPLSVKAARRREYLARLHEAQ